MGVVVRGNQEIIRLYPWISAHVLTDSSATMLKCLSAIVEPNAKTPYHSHPENETSLLVLGGKLEITVAGCKFVAEEGDCALVRAGEPVMFANSNTAQARVFMFFAGTASPKTELCGVPASIKDTYPEVGFFRRQDNEPYEFEPGIMRYDMVGDFQGARTSYLSELTFEPGSRVKNHYHPAHQETMFCIAGSLSCVYGDAEDVSLPTDAAFTCESGVRHGLVNRSEGVSKLLAIHPVLNPPPRVLVA